MAKKVLITGVNGFVGEHLVNAFKKDGVIVFGLAFDNTPNEKVVQNLDSYLSCNLLEESAVNHLDLSGLDAVVHLAGLSSVGQSFEQPHRYIGDNALMTYNLLQKISTDSPSCRVIIISTGALYDPTAPLPLTETSPTQSSSPYAIGKLATEHVADYFRARGLSATTVRPFNHIGPGQGQGFLLPDLYQQLEAAGVGGEIKVGNLSTRRDYTDVRDIVEAYKVLALGAAPGHNLYNVCSGRSLSGYDILSLLQEASGKTDIATVVDPAKIRPTDIADIYGDSTRLQQELGWKPLYPIEQTVRDFVASRRGDQA